MNFKKLINRRAVLSPESGAIRCGWILGASSDGLEVQMSHGDQFDPGEVIDIAISIPDETVRITGIAESAPMGMAVIRVSETARSESSSHDCRTRVHLVESVATASGKFPVDVVDISKNGVGILTDVLLVIGTEIRLHFDSTGEPIRLDCAVRYAHPEQDRYRIGLEIMGADSKSMRCWEAMNLPDRNLEFVDETTRRVAS